MEDREHDVDRAQSRRRVRRRDGQGLGDRAVVAGTELPAAVAADRHGDDLVLLGIEGLEHRPGGCQGDLMLARAPAGEDGDPETAAQGGGPGCCVNLPTTIVTTVPGGACFPPAGSWERTMPSCDWSVTSCVTMCTRKPDACSCACADA